MSIIDNIFSRFGFVNEKQFKTKLAEAVKSEIERVLPDWLGETADAAKNDMPPMEVFANQADLYRLSPILGTAVDILASDIGTAKINVKRRKGEELVDIPNHPYELLLRNPNPADSGLELAQYTVSNYLLNGNAIRWLNRASANDIPDEIWPIPFSKITPIPDEQLYISHYEYEPGGGKPKMRLETWEIVHYKKYNPNNRFIGLSPIESLAVTIQGDLSMRRTNTVTYAKHGGVPPSILVFKDFVPDPAWAEIKRKVTDSTKRDEMMMLRGAGEGVSWMQRAMSNKDSEFLSGLRQNLTDVFNRMCPGLIAMLSENATEANALAARATYAEKTLWPMMEVLAQKDTSDILPSYGRNLMCIYDDPRVVDRKLELEEQSAYERTHTVAEVRKEYYQDKPVGDERDDLFPAQVGQSAKPEEEDPEDGDPKNEEPAGEDEPVAEDKKEDDAALKAELLKWKRYSLRTFGKAAFGTFENALIPQGVAIPIRARLSTCKTAADVADVFEQEMTATQSNKSEILLLASVINNAVAEVEK